MHRGFLWLLGALGLLALGCGKSSADVLLEPPAAADSGVAPDDAYLQTAAKNFGYVQLHVSRGNQIVAFRTIMNVPAVPTATAGTLFLTTGLQPGGQNYDPIDNGVLEAVLTWGSTCAPNAPSGASTSFWISGQYVNTYGNYAGYTGCHGGEGMLVQVGDPLSIHLTLAGTVWTTDIEDLGTGGDVTFTWDLLGQSQNYAQFWLDPASTEPVADSIFNATTITFAEPEPDACLPDLRGHTDFFSNPRVSSDGTQCSIERIVLRAQGVPATSQN
jgi:hypothetical protein